MAQKEIINGQKTVVAFNINTGEMEPFSISIVNNEFVLTASDKSFIKFPVTMTVEEIKESLDKYALEHAHIPEAAKAKQEEEKRNKELLAQF